MIVLTVDQVDSRHEGDRVADLLATAPDRWGREVLLGPDRTAGDEFQLLPRDAQAAVTVALDLLRDGGWSVGMGIGPVSLPLPPTTREATGPAFVAAREAVTTAKRAPYRFALVAATTAGPVVDGDGVSALFELLLELRQRRSPEGWQVADRLATGATQAAVADELGITPQAVSLRARTAGVRLERRALPALTRLVAALDVGGPE